MKFQLSACPLCNSDLVENIPACLSCTNENCGIIAEEGYIIEDEYIEPPARPYTRKTDNVSTLNFHKIIKSLQGIETRKICKPVMEKIRNYLDQENLDYTHQNINQYLKLTKRTHLYPHVSVIYFKLTGIRPDPIDRSIVYELLRYFKKIEISWNFIRPGYRYNLPNYNYILKKLLQLIDHNWVIDHLNISHCYQCDNGVNHANYIWFLICNYFDWSYFPEYS